MSLRRLLLALGALSFSVVACSNREFTDRDPGDDGEGGGGGERPGDAAGGAETGGSSTGGGSTGGSHASGGDGGDAGECTEGERECVDATTLRTCSSERTWAYDECASCENDTCLHTITLCTDDNRSSTALVLEVTCAGEVTELPFLHATAAADGCMEKTTVFCEPDQAVSIAITGASSSYNPEAIFVGSNASDGVACTERATCDAVMPDGPLFVRGVVCDSDTDGETGCPW